MRTPDSETFDSVYRPYVTPPTPFEKTTHNLEVNSDSNPYAQSMWWTTRGNTGDEIKKYKGKLEDKQQTNSPKESQESKEALKEAHDTLWKLLHECDHSIDSMHESNVHTVKKPNVEVGKGAKSYKRSLLPSLMAKVETIDDSNYGDYFGYDNDKHQKHESIIDDGLSMEIIQSYINEKPCDDKLLKQLKSPLPYECIKIQSTLVKKLKCLAEISVTFDKYAEDESIVVNSKVKLHIFSNIKTLLIIHYNFFESMISKNYTDTEEMVYDHLQRLYHVYPSYFSSMEIRKHFTHLILDNKMFGGFLGDVTREEFIALVLSPADDFIKLLEFLDSYIAKSSPRIEVLISKLRNLYINPTETTVKYDSKEALYLKVPAEWKKLHKIRWKEIHNLKATRQVAAYLRWMLKAHFQEYRKIINLIRNQIENISRLGVNNKHLTVCMKRLEDFPGTDGNRMSFNIDDQNKQIYSLVDTFFQFINDESFEECESLMKKACIITKKIFNDEETNYVPEKLFNVHLFMKMFRHRAYLVFVKFVSFFHAFVGLMDQSGAEDINSIVNNFIQAREVSVIGGWEKFMAREKVAKRLGIKQIHKGSVQ